MRKLKRILQIEKKKYFEMADGKPLVYFVDESDGYRQFHWITGIRRLKTLHRWIGRVIEQYESKR